MPYPCSFCNQQQNGASSELHPIPSSDSFQNVLKMVDPNQQHVVKSPSRRKARKMKHHSTDTPAVPQPDETRPEIVVNNN
jgi:hypothetical protein